MLVLVEKVKVFFFYSFGGDLRFEVLLRHRACRGGMALC